MKIKAINNKKGKIIKNNNKLYGKSYNKQFRFKNDNKSYVTKMQKFDFYSSYLIIRNQM